jgi:hypothetical protein
MPQQVSLELGRGLLPLLHLLKHLAELLEAQLPVPVTVQLRAQQTHF